MKVLEQLRFLMEYNQNHDCCRDKYHVFSIVSSFLQFILLLTLSRIVAHITKGKH